jgi:predicted phage terminase large subunit-like protein
MKKAKDTDLLHELALERELFRREAERHFRVFLDYTQQNYSRQWFHTLIAEKCQALFEGTLPTNKLMIFVPPQHGKELKDSTLTPTPNGFRRHGDLKPGDYVFGRDGKAVRVLAVSEKVLSEYRVTFSDGSMFDCHGNHEWVVTDNSKHKEVTIETKQMAAQPLYSGIQGKRGCSYRFMVDSVVCVEFEPKAVAIDPYTLGAWLGDGVSEWPKIHIGGGDIEILNNIPYETNEGNGTTDRVFYIHGVSKQFKQYGLLGNKHIPDDYIFNSAEVRKQLIAGLIDTDGYVYPKNGRVTISNTNKRIIDSATLILRSLGQNVVVTAYEPRVSSSGIVGRQTVYQLCFNPTTDFPTVVPRKRIGRTITNRRRAIVSIEPLAESEREQGNCIQVEGGVYLVGERFVPTHNSEIVSRKFPAWALGRNPKTRLVGCSYSADLAQQFSRSIQRTIDDDCYKEVFPETQLNGGKQSGFIRNVDLFEVVGYGGFYKAVGVGGSLTGTPVDIGIIDDPVKDALEANSETYRNRVWEWYTDVFLTRLHNNSKQILIQTRWHADDLAGRLLDREGDTWTVVSIPAIREDKLMADDPREVGEALWEERHSLVRLREIEKRSPRTFAALYQQRPTIEGGNIVKSDWFRRVTQYDFDHIHGNEPMVFFIDTAYTDKSDNDPTGIIATCKIGNDIYVAHGEKVLMRFPDLLRFLPNYVKEHGYTQASSVRIEPKANGLSVIDQLRATTGLNVVATPSPHDSKETRLNAASPTIESGRVVLVDGAWTEQFIDEVCGFPSKPHDEYVDVLCYAIDYHSKDLRPNGKLGGFFY